nr:FapA family protein [Geobacter sp. FeAm09]
MTGETIPPVPGKPLALKIGKNITAEDSGERLVAAAAGRVCVASGEISVEEEYVVSGDVNFRVGSIVFNGVVEVRGDVLDDFSVHATKGLRVSGNIGNCRIESGGDISFCGMDGQGKGTIACGGNITAQFIHDCTIECAGDIFVEVELHNCTVRTLGRIIVNKGAIAGGTYAALGGVEAKKIGSLASVRTKLTVGVDYHDAEELERLMEELALNHKQSGEAGTLQEIEELRQKRATLTDRIMALRSKVDERSNPKVNVKGTLYDNTLLVVGMQNEEVRDPHDGPLSASENTIDGGLRYLSLTSLDVKAADIEKAFILEYQKR